jgi:hypothetical protein
LNFYINAFNKRKPIRRRLKSYGGTGEKAQSRGGGMSSTF